MKVAIIRTIQEGIALSRSELIDTPRHKGHFVVEDWADSNAFARPIRRARLISSMQGVRDVDIVAPLFDPALVKVRDERMALVDHEIHAAGGIIRHVCQVWMVRQISASPE